MEQLLFKAGLVLIGFILWAGVWGLWKGSESLGLFIRLVYYPLVLLLYSGGLFLVMAGLGVDNWDDSSAWYWDTWLLLGSSALVCVSYAITRLKGVMRVLLTAFPVAGLAALVWFYISTP